MGDIGGPRIRLASRSAERSDMSAFMIYGATAYTGRLAVERAVESGLDVIVAGRDPRRVAPLGVEFDVDSRAFSLDDPATVRDRPGPAGGATVGDDFLPGGARPSE